MDDDQQGDPEEEGDEGDAADEYGETDEEVLYAGQPGNIRGRVWRRGRSRYGSRFGRRGFGPRQSTRPLKEQLNKEPLRVLMHKIVLPKSRLPQISQDHPTSNMGALTIGATSAMSLGTFSRFTPISVGEGNVSMCPINVPRVFNSNTMAVVILATCLCGTAISPQATNRGGAQRPIQTKESRRVGNAGACSASVQPKLDSTMRIADEQQQHEQPEGALVLGKDFQPHLL